MKKEIYITQENHSKKLASWAEVLHEIKAHKPFTLDPHQAALLILDLQQYFFESESHAFIPNSQFIIPQIQILISYAKEHKIPVIFTRHLGNRRQKNIMNYFWGGIIEETDPLSQITPEVDAAQSLVINKTTYSAFYNTTLHSILQQQKVSQLIVCGVMAHLCVETTIRDAFLQNYECFLPMDATASYSEALHMGTLRAIHHGFGIVCTTADIIGHRV